MLSYTESNETHLSKNSENNFNSHIENNDKWQISEKNEVIKNNGNRKEQMTKNSEMFERESQNEYNKIDKIKIRRSGDSGYRNNSENMAEGEVDCEVINNISETSTGPSKFKKRSPHKNKKESNSDSSSNSSYHNRKRKRNNSRRKRSSSQRRRNYNKRSHSRSKRRDRKTERSSRNKRYEKDKKKKSKRSESSSSSNSSDSESTIKKKNFYQERRRVRQKSRSNSALRVMKLKNLENACGYYQRFYQRPHEDNDPTKPQLYWDGYQWVIRPTTIAEQNFDIIKPGRKVQIANVPIHLNIQINLFKEFLIAKILEKNIVSKKDVKDINNIITGIEFDQENNTAIVVMESIDLAKSMVLLDALILLGYTLRFSLYQDVNENDTSSSNVIKAAALANSAHLSAKSAAIAFAALKNIGGKSDSVNVNLDGVDLQKTLPSSKIIKVMNLIDPKEILKLKSERFEEILDDIKDEFEKFGHIVTGIIIKPKKEKLGAEIGAVFIEYQEVKFAENCLKGMKDKRYEGRDLKLAYIDENVFRKDIL